MSPFNPNNNMKTINKMLVGALLLITARAAFASNLPTHKTTIQPQRDIVRLIKAKAANDAVVWINVYEHYVGATYNGSGYLYHYQLQVNLTYNGNAVSNRASAAFVLNLQIATGTGETYLNAPWFEFDVAPGSSASQVVDVYGDHQLSETDVVGYGQNAYTFEYNGVTYDLDLNSSPIID